MCREGKYTGALLEEGDGVEVHAEGVDAQGDSEPSKKAEGEEGPGEDEDKGETESDVWNEDMWGETREELLEEAVHVRAGDAEARFKGETA